MDFLSDGTKKERRNLLATGFAGIIVAQLKIYPTEVDVLGLKFQSPDLPLIAVGGLCAVIIYFLVKFYSSYLYERSSRETKVLTTLIRDWKPTMDPAREEEGLNDQARNLIRKREVLHNQQENAEKRIKTLRDEIDQEDSSHEASLKIADQEISDLEQTLAKDAGEHVRTSDATLYHRGDIEKKIKRLRESRESYLVNRETKRRQNIENWKNEKNNWKEIYEATVKELKTNENAFNEKRRYIAEWKQANKLRGWLSPWHLFLEIHLPLFIGGMAIINLIWLMFHFPTSPKPPSLPDF